MPTKPVGRPAHSYVAVDNKTLHDTQLLIKEVDSRSRVNFTQLKNAQIEIGALQASITQLEMSLNKLVAVLLTVHDEPTKLGEVQAVLRDFLNKGQSQNNRKST